MCVAADLRGTVDCEAEAHSMVQVAMLCSSVLLPLGGGRIYRARPFDDGRGLGCGFAMSHI